MNALGVLDRFVRRAHRVSIAPESRCELCAQSIRDPHRHVVDLVDRRILCSCDACAVLFRDGGSRRHRTVPDRVLFDPSWTFASSDLDALGVPVGLAFFFRASKLPAPEQRSDRWTVVFPSPGGPTEAELSDRAFSELEERLPPRGRELLRSVQDDVEAILVRRTRAGQCTTFVVPIDVCYELVGLLRQHWRGIDGGDEARGVVDDFFRQLAKRSAWTLESNDSQPTLDSTAAAERFDRMRKIADTLLLEGYVLYPYRADSMKNRYRWTFGVLAPRSWSEVDGGERWWLEAQVLVESKRPRLRGRLRFLHVVERRIEVRDDSGAFRPTPELEIGGRLWVPWEEGEIREIDFRVESNEGDGDVLVPFSIPASEEIEPLQNAPGNREARVVRARAAVHGAIRVHVDRFHTSGPPLSRVDVRIENVTIHPSEAPRAEVMRASCISTHLLLASEDGDFISSIDPPHHARELAASCRNVGTFPALGGEPGSADLMLCSPIVLYDHPQISPESPGDFFDATEIDELLALRTMTLTPEEKARARATDPRAAVIIDRVEKLSNEELARLHGTNRERRRFAPGQRVRLRRKTETSSRRTDAQDLLYEGRVATIEAILEDVDGRAYLAVTIDDDPAAELHRFRGRFHHYYPDEVETL